MLAVGKEEIYKMERRMGALDTIVMISPLLGILGTVTGIISSFNVMAALEGVAQASALSSGIAEGINYYSSRFNHSHSHNGFIIIFKWNNQ